jgi:hypothetical protein
MVFIYGQAVSLYLIPQFSTRSDGFSRISSQKEPGWQVWLIKNDLLKGKVMETITSQDQLIEISKSLPTEETHPISVGDEETNVIQDSSRYEGFFGPERKGIDHGITGGLAMMGIAVVWFVVGYASGVLFYYPPILFVIGLYAFIKGVFTGNISGNKDER